MDVPATQELGNTSPEGHGFIVSDGHPVSWSRYREMNAEVMSHEHSLAFGQCVDVVQLNEAIQHINTPCYIVPTNKMIPSTQTVTVRLNQENAFDSAGAQANLWLAAYSESMYQGFMGGVDRDFIEISKHRAISKDDVFLVECTLGKRFFGVLELKEPVSGSEWHCLIHWPSKPDSNVVGKELLNVHLVSMDDFTAMFRRPLARILTVTSSPS